MAPMISVIVPVYNSQATINRCLDSILGQTFKDFEIVIVNDGSADNSQSICEKYAVAHPERIRVIQQENSGPSSARNNGIHQSRGKYIAFVDSDDYIAPTMLERMVCAAEESGAEMVVCGYYKMWHGEQKEYSLFYPTGLYTGDALEQIASVSIDDVSVKAIPPYSSIRLVVKSVFTEHGLCYNENLIRSEDYHLWVRVNFHIKKLFLLSEEHLYYYVENPRSITHKYIKGYWNGVKIIYEDLKRILRNTEEIQDKIDRMLIRRSMIALNNASYCTDRGQASRELKVIINDPLLNGVIRTVSKESFKMYGMYAKLMKYNLKFAVFLKYKMRNIMKRNRNNI